MIRWIAPVVWHLIAILSRHYNIRAVIPNISAPLEMLSDKYWKSSFPGFLIWCKSLFYFITLCRILALIIDLSIVNSQEESDHVQCKLLVLVYSIRSILRVATTHIIEIKHSSHLFSRWKKTTKRLLLKGKVKKGTKTPQNFVLRRQFSDPCSTHAYRLLAACSEAAPPVSSPAAL